MKGRKSSQFLPKIGEVYMMQFDGSDSEQKGMRPGIVFQNNIGNQYSPNIVALPITSSIKKAEMPTHVVLKSEDTGLYRDSMVLCENPSPISKAKVGAYITTLPDYYMKQIAEASMLASSVISYLDYSTLMRVWDRAKQMNERVVLDDAC